MLSTDGVLGTDQLRVSAWISPHEGPSRTSTAGAWFWIEPGYVSTPYGAGGLSGAAVVNSWLEWDLGWLKGGTWSMTARFYTDTSLAIAQYSLNGVVLGTQDLYSASLNMAPTPKVITGITVPEGPATFRLTANPKNVASSGNSVHNRGIVLRRTGP